MILLLSEVIKVGIAVSDLLSCFKAAGYRRCIVCQVFFFRPTFPMKSEEPHLFFFCNGPEQFTAPLR